MDVIVMNEFEIYNQFQESRIIQLTSLQPS